MDTKASGKRPTKPLLRIPEWKTIPLKKKKKRFHKSTFFLIQMPSKSIGETGKDTACSLAQGNCPSIGQICPHEANILRVDGLPHPKTNHSPLQQKE